MGKDTADNGVGVTGLIVISVTVVGFIVGGSISKNSSEAKMPPTQAAFIQGLDTFRNRYGTAENNKNEIQQNRIFDARKQELLCKTELQVSNWIGEVDRVETSWVNSRQRAWLNLQVSSHDVWLNGRIINSTENPELFGIIAKLNKGDHVTVSGTLSHYDGCVSERSLTQHGGMTTPEFNIEYSEIKRP